MPSSSLSPLRGRPTDTGGFAGHVIFHPLRVRASGRLTPEAVIVSFDVSSPSARGVWLHTGPIYLTLRLRHLMDKFCGARIQSAQVSMTASCGRRAQRCGGGVFSNWINATVPVTP
jgi:hypothetical protein